MTNIHELISQVSALDASTIILSFVATIISIKSLIISKTTIINTTITNNRIEWISDVRALIQQFIEEYIKGDDADLNKKIALATNIKLYMREGGAYDSFIEALNRCATSKYTDYNSDDYKALVRCSQEVLNDVWVRMKREAGISKRSEEKLIKKMNDEKG